MTKRASNGPSNGARRPPTRLTTTVIRFPSTTLRARVMTAWTASVSMPGRVETVPTAVSTVLSTVVSRVRGLPDPSAPAGRAETAETAAPKTLLSSLTRDPTASGVAVDEVSEVSPLTIGPTSLRTPVKIEVKSPSWRASTSRFSAAGAGTGAGAGMADARVPNARAVNVAIFMKENMAVI